MKNSNEHIHIYKELIQIALCDDQPAFIEAFSQLLVSFLETEKLLFSLTSFRDSESLLESDIHFDIIFLDIQMDKMSGLEAARILRERNIRSRIVFLTAYKQYVFNAFEVEAFHYLVKPVSPDKLYHVMNRLLKLLASEQNQQFVFKTGNVVNSVRFCDLLFVEVIDRKIYLHMEKEVLDFYGKIQYLEAQLQPDFFRCHRSYLVNLSKIIRFDNTSINLSNRESIPLSKRKYERFSAVFFEHIRKDSSL